MLAAERDKGFLKMDYMEIIDKYYQKGTRARKVYLSHVRAVTKKALQIAKKNKHLDPDLRFIEEAAMLHDIGIIFTDAPQLGCNGRHLYIAHLRLGHDLLKKKYPKHARVCLTHTGIFKDLIVKKKYPLPKRDIIPETVEEKIIYLADKFFSKSHFNKERTIPEIRSFLAKYDQRQVDLFESVSKELDL